MNNIIIKFNYIFKTKIFQAFSINIGNENIERLDINILDLDDKIKYYESNSIDDNYIELMNTYYKYMNEYKYIIELLLTIDIQNNKLIKKK